MILKRKTKKKIKTKKQIKRDTTYKTHRITQHVDKKSKPNELSRSVKTKLLNNKVKYITMKNNNTGLDRKYYKLNLSQENVEFMLLLSVLINTILLLKKMKKSEKYIKNHIIKILKDIRKNNKLIKSTTSDQDLDAIYKVLSTKLQVIKQNLNNNNTTKNTEKKSGEGKSLNNEVYKTKGGFYFKSLEEKGDKPITGADLAKLLDEIQDFFYNAKYTQEGAFLRDVDTLISMLRGDVGQFKNYLIYQIFPKYYQVTPPFIKWDGIKAAWDSAKYEDLPDYLLAYQKYLRSRDEYLVEKGLKSPKVLKRGLYTGFYDKLAKSLDKNVTAFQQYRRKARMQFYPVGVPV
jgi:hypothetical protein